MDKIHQLALNKSNLYKLLLALGLLINLVSWKATDSIYILMIFLTLILWVKSQSKSSLEIRFSALDSLIIIWLAANFLGAFFAPAIVEDRWHNFFDLRWVMSFYLCIIAGQSAGNLKEITKYFQPALIAVLVISLAWQRTHPTGNTYGGFERFHGFYENPIPFALTLLTLWAFFLGWEVSRIQFKLPLSKVNISTLFFLFIMLYATFTRGAWVAIALCVILAVGMAKNSKVNLLFGAAILAAGIVFAMNLFSFKDRILYSTQVSAGNSQALRILIWKTSWNIFKDHPIVGVGFTENRYLFAQYYKDLGAGDQEILVHSHNQYLQTLNDSGLIGFIAFYSAVFMGLVFFYKKTKVHSNLEQKKIATAALFTMVAFLVSSFFDCPILSPAVRNSLFLTLGFSYGYLANPFPNLKRAITSQ